MYVLYFVHNHALLSSLSFPFSTFLLHPFLFPHRPLSNFSAFLKASVLHMRENILHLTFEVWLFLFFFVCFLANMIVSGSIHFLHDFYHSLRLNKTPLWSINTFSLSSVDEDIDCFHILAFVNNTEINVNIHVSLGYILP